ncbi:hypothetical protein MAP00_005820 [Monascus purpureus]|nr:hypothetical protein MAP00_005820 [Monascus purpureus]
MTGDSTGQASAPFRVTPPANNPDHTQLDNDELPNQTHEYDSPWARPRRSGYILVSTLLYFALPSAPGL